MTEQFFISEHGKVVPVSKFEYERWYKHYARNVKSVAPDGSESFEEVKHD